MRKTVARKLALILALALTLTLFFTACSSSSDSGASSDAGTTDSAAPADDGGSDDGGAAADTSGEAKKVFIIASNLGDPFFAAGYDVMKSLCEERGWDVQLEECQGDAATQANKFSNAISQNVDLIIADVIDTAAVGPSLVEAHDAGIDVILPWADCDEAYEQYRISYVGADDLEAGDVAAKSFINAFPDGAKVVCVEAPAGQSAQIRRHDGFYAGLEGSNIEILDSKCCNTFSAADAQTIAEDFFTRYGDQIDGIYVHWDDAATAVIEAAKNAGYQPGDLYIIGVDGNYASWEAIKEGWQQATMFQSVSKCAEMTLETLDKYYAGEEVESFTKVPIIEITKDNVDDYDPGW